jgi:hypothetical protein
MNVFNRWKEKANNFIDVRLGLLKLSLIERTSSVIGRLLLSFIYIFLGMTVLSFIGFGLMEVFAAWFDSRIGGAFATAGLFLLLLIIVFAMRKAILSAFAGIFISLLTEGDDDDDDDDKKDSRKIDVD